MKPNRLHYAAVGMLVAALVLAACGGATATQAPAAEPQHKVLLITEDPIGINPYFISATEGLERAAQEFNLETKIVEGTGDPTKNEENLRAVSREDWELIIVMTFGFTDLLTEVAPETPDKIYVCIDCFVDAPNVRSVDFLTHEAAFLLGAAAGQLTESNVVGQVGPLDIPFMHRWIDPWAKGVEYVNPEAEVLETLWVGDWADPATAKELALRLSDQGADQINGVAAAGNPGIFEAAAERNFFTSGVDINECPKQPGHIVDNVIKRVDLSVYNSIKDFLDGKAMGGPVAYGLKDGGVDLAVFAFEGTETECVLAEHPDVIERVSELRQQVIDGAIVIPDPVVGGEYVLP
jgi:basic membrane protein A